MQSLGTRIRNRLKNYLSLENVFQFLSLPDIHTHNGIVPQLNFLVKTQLFVLLHLYLDKNDSLSKLYQSKSLQGMLDHFINIFITKLPKKNYRQQLNTRFIPYMQSYSHYLQYQSQNQRDYYNNLVHPLLQKLYWIFEKMSNRQNNINYKKIVLLLQEIRPMQLNQNHLLKKIKYGMQLIDLKWRNFVDAD